jgi:hypothetical protein
MKHYPSIPTHVLYDVPVFVYKKLDGSNIRVEWSKKKGRSHGEFYKFGTRKRLLASDNFMHDEVKGLLKQSADELEEFLLNKLRCDRAICYFEFYGPGSFAGSHRADEPHQLALLDVEVYKKGFVLQTDYLHFEEQKSSTVHVPELIAHGTISEEYEEKIRSGTVGSFEGVVCKSEQMDRKRQRITFKIKNRAWVKRARELDKLGEDDA